MKRTYKSANRAPKSARPRCCPFVLRATPETSIDLGGSCCIPRILQSRRPSDTFGHSCGSYNMDERAASRIVSVRSELRKINMKMDLLEGYRDEAGGDPPQRST